MNRTEQKARIKGILEDINYVYKGIKSQENKAQEIFKKMDKLDCLFNELGEMEDWDIDTLKTNVTRLILDSVDFYAVKENFDDFKYELEDYMDELSDNKREKLEEKYTNLEIVGDMLDTFEEEVNDLDEAYDKLKEIKDYLKGMM